MKLNPISRLLLLLAMALLSSCGNNSPKIENQFLQIQFNDSLFSKVTSTLENENKTLNDYSATEYVVVDGKEIKNYFIKKVERRDIENIIGEGEELVVTGLSNEGIQKQVSVSIYDDFPTAAIFNVTYINNGKKKITINKWVNNSYNINTTSKEEPAFWSYQGASFEDRRDWVQPLTDGFVQENYMGMNNIDYGGGTPISDIWTRDIGIAVGHIESTQKLVKIPVRMKKQETGVDISVEFEKEVILQPGESMETFETFLNIHKRDYYPTLKIFREVMAKKGLTAPQFTESTYEPIWCAWGYERNFKVEEVLRTLPKVKELGFKWAVLDDGWQTAEGDWYLHPKKFPNGDADMKKFVDKIHSYGLKAKLWWAPLAVDPGTDLLKDHSDMLLLNKDGSKQDITWWDSYYLCPAYDKTLSYTKDLVLKIMQEWGYDGLKIDGQHLNGVPACYNPLHNHAYPEESVEKLREFWSMVYETALNIQKEAVVEICPCGTCYSFYNLQYMNQPVSSDPLSSWQIRLKGKTLKGLMGENLPYYGDHVELSDNGNDWATTVGIGGVIGTKFMWPAGLHNKKMSSADLTPAKEIKLKKWMKIYNEKMLPKGIYLGELYDIGFDKPETHVVEKDGNMFYAFYAPEWNGNVEFRGLENKTYIVTDYVNNKKLGEVKGPIASLQAKFNGSLLIECNPKK